MSVSVFVWNPSPARKRPTPQSVVAVTHSREAGDHVPHVTDQCHTNTDGNDLTILLNNDTFEHRAAVISITEPSTSKDTWGLLLLLRVACYDALLLRTPPQSLFAHNVYFVGGDINMRAFATVSDVFTDHSLHLLAMLICGALVASTSPTKTAPASSSCSGARTRGEFINTDAQCSTTQTSVSRQVICPRTSLSSSTSGSLTSPGPSSVMRSAQAQLRRLERVSGKNERKRLRQRLAQQSSPSASSTQPQTNTAPAGIPTIQQQPTSTAQSENLPATHSSQRPISSMPSDAV